MEKAVDFVVKVKRGLVASSVNVRIRVLRTFFNVLHQEGIEGSRHKSWEQWPDIMALILDSGIRLNEIGSLEKKDINFAKRPIVLPAFKNKNRKSRILLLSAETVRLLKQLMAESSAVFESPYVHNELRRTTKREDSPEGIQ